MHTIIIQTHAFNTNVLSCPSCLVFNRCIDLLKHAHINGNGVDKAKTGNARGSLYFAMKNGK